MKDHNDAAAAMQARLERVSMLPHTLAPRIAGEVQGHVGESAVSVAGASQGATVSVSGPDAAHQRLGVHSRASAAVRNALKDADDA